MELNTATLGQSFTITADFYDQNGVAFAGNSPAKYLIKDFNGNNILKGYGAQDGMFAQRWTAQVTLPKSAPYDPNKKYLLLWTLTGGANGNSVASQTELFNVQPLEFIEENDYHESVVPYGGTITDSLVLDGAATAQNVSIKILDENETVYGTADVDATQILNFNGNNAYVVDLDSQDLAVSFRPYVMQWTYLLNGRTKREYHFIYVVSTKIMMMMENLRNLIDKIRFNHPNPNLRYSEADLMGYLIQGMKILNGVKPQVTSWTLQSFPLELDWYLTNAAAYVALSAQYLAEGVSAFEMNGASVSLTIDRAQFIDSALSRIIDVIDNKFPTVKTNLIKAGSPGTLYLSYSPSFNPTVGFDRLGFGNQDYFSGDFRQRFQLYNGVIDRFTVNMLD